MSWKKFAGPTILAGIAILLLLAININGNMKYDEGDTVDPNFLTSSCCMGLLSILSCLSSIVWFSFALGMRSDKTVFLEGGPDNSRHSSAHVASDSQSNVASSGIGGGAVSYVREKIAIEKSEGDTARMVGFLVIFGSIAMFALMVLLGFISILMSLGPGLGFSGGTCNDTCESIWAGAVLSKWISLLLFPCGLIALARPWSWSAEDIPSAAVKVIPVIVAGIALIAVISYGVPALIVLLIAGIVWSIYFQMEDVKKVISFIVAGIALISVIAFGGPALIVLLVAGMAWLIYYQMEDVELKALKLDEVNELVWTISTPLILVAAIALIFEFGFYSLFGRFGRYGMFGIGAFALLIIAAFVPLVVCVIVVALFVILSKLNFVGTDGDWGTLDLINSVYSDIFSDEDDAPESEHEFVSESEEGWWEGQSE